MMVESLCPDCLHTVTKSFAPAIDQGLFEIADVTFVPYGNSKETLQAQDIYSYKCQNTQDECYGNALYSCILHHMADKEQANKALVCMFTAVDAKASNFNQSLIDCSKKFNFNSSEVWACANNQEGNKLQHQAALATPKHHGVPWPVVEGKFLTAFDRTLINEDVMKYACRKYVGPVKLPACQQYAFGDVEKLEIFYFVESLCPDSVHTIGKVNEAVDKGLNYIADVDFVFAGNAKVVGQKDGVWDFTCQHGPSECYGNQLESCIWYNSPDRLGAMYSIACMFAKTHTDGTLFDGALEECAAEYISFDPEAVKACA